MKIQLRLNIPTLLALFLICAAVASAEPVNRTNNVLQNTPIYPELEGAYGISVAVESRIQEPDKYGLIPTDIKNRVKAKLTDAGIKISNQAPTYKRVTSDILFVDVPEMRIEPEIINAGTSGKCIITVRTSLAIHIHPRNQDEMIYYPADVWKADSGMQIVECNSVADKVSSIIDGQVQMFINTCNQMRYGVSQPDANQVNRQQHRKVTGRQPKSVEKQIGEQKFIASKNSDVFHRPECPFAQSISPKNIIDYNSPEEALAAGKRPCKKCNPQ